MHLKMDTKIRIIQIQIIKIIGKIKIEIIIILEDEEEEEEEEI